ATLEVDVAEAGTGDLDVTFYGREVVDAGGGGGGGGASEDAFSLIVLPDTQNYSDSATNIVHFNNQSDWILEQREARNIKAVITVGDITNFNSSANRTRAMGALNPLQIPELPLALVPGNHDY